MLNYFWLLSKLIFSFAASRCSWHGATWSSVRDKGVSSASLGVQMFTRTVGNICLSARSNNRHVADHCVHRWDTMLCSTLTAYFLHLMCKSNLVSENSILYFQFVPRRFIEEHSWPILGFCQWTLLELEWIAGDSWIRALPSLFRPSQWYSPCWLLLLA